MNSPANLDPFNLAKLSETIDKQVFRILAKEFSSVVSEDALKALKRKLRDAISALMVEMWHDISHLQQNPKIGGILVSNERIPTVAQLAEQIPTVYVQPVQSGDADTDKRAEVSSRVNQVKWVFNTWLQVYGQLIQRLADGSPVAVETTFNFDGVDEPIRVPQPSEIDTVSAAWQIVRRLTLEYLSSKAELLIATGENVPHVAINYTDDTDRGLIELRQAFWSNSPHTNILLLQTLRSVLLRALQLERDDVPIDLRFIPTSQLIVLAQGAGLKLPFSLELLGNIAYDLEGSLSTCQPLKVSILYPFYRVLEDTISQILKMPPNEEIQRRAYEILKRNAQAVNHDSKAQTDYQRYRCYRSDCR